MHSRHGAPELSLQPPLEVAVASRRLHLSEGTRGGNKVLESVLCRSASRTWSLVRAAPSLDAIVRSGTPRACAISRLLYPCRWRRTRAAAFFGGSARSS